MSEWFERTRDLKKKKQKKIINDSPKQKITKEKIKWHKSFTLHKELKKKKWYETFGKAQSFFNIDISNYVMAFLSSFVDGCGKFFFDAYLDRTNKNNKKYYPIQWSNFFPWTEVVCDFWWYLTRFPFNYRRSR